MDVSLVLRDRPRFRGHRRVFDCCEDIEKTDEASLAADDCGMPDDVRRLARRKRVDTVDAMDGFVRREGVLAGSTWN